MPIASIAALTVAQVVLSPSPSPCPPTAVTRLQCADCGPDPEWHGPTAGLAPNIVIAVVEVTVEPDGTIKSAKIWKSSGTPDGDRTALAAARNSTYSPATLNCKPVEGKYLFKERFVVAN